MVEDLIKRLRDTVEEEAGHGVRNEAADLIEQQAVEIIELKAQMANAGEQIADFERILEGLPQDAINGGWTARGISAYAKRLEDRLTALESERDALLAAAGKEAVAVASDAWEAYLAEQKLIVGMPGLHARPSFIAGFHAAMAWQPIDTAPKDGTPLILFARAKHATASAPVIGWWLPDMGWIESAYAPNHPVGIVPSHWMPRPEFPAALSQKAGEQQ